MRNTYGPASRALTIIGTYSYLERVDIAGA